MAHAASSPSRPATTGGLYARIYQLVALIPAGRVASYGQIANILGTCGARQIGYALAALPNELDVPWHRVVNAQGRISPRANGDDGSRQRRKLAREGVLTDSRGRIDLARHGWAGPAPDWFEAQP